ncbi:hypothetical protein [Paramicrobacterium chengjingii]|uniref:hypothetical protein n=1 Tax=Paramicrobacterium chengjingii TaxID=2769067 RepID=UPI00141DFC26|nr:hypothetical protein [Microbacterium chengjingii]
MNTPDHMNEAEQHRQSVDAETARRASKLPEGAEAAEVAGTPDAVKERASRAAVKEKLTQVRGRGIDWVRPTDLMAQSGGALSRRGIDFTTAVGRRLRTPVEASARWTAQRARRLPPVSAFGRHNATGHGQGRSGIGMTQ